MKRQRAKFFWHRTPPGTGAVRQSPTLWRTPPGRGYLFLTAADDAGRTRSRRFGERLGHGDRAFGGRVNLEHANRAVPDDRLGTEQDLAERRDRLRTRVDAFPITRDGRGGDDFGRAERARL